MISTMVGAKVPLIANAAAIDHVLETSCFAARGDKLCASFLWARATAAAERRARASDEVNTIKASVWSCSAEPRVQGGGRAQRCRSEDCSPLSTYIMGFESTATLSRSASTVHAIARALRSLV